MTALATPARRYVPAGRVMRAALRRNKITLAAVASSFAVCALLLFIEAITVRSDVDAHHLSSCLWQVNFRSSCYNNRAWVALLDRPYETKWIPYGLLLVPGAVAMFGGTRWLAREYDTGAFRYTWAQSVSRTRWLAGTGAPLLATAVAGAALCGLAFNWWYPLVGWFSDYAPQGTAWRLESFPLDPFGYASLTLLAFALAALAAALLRKTLPAMVVTLLGYLGLLAVADLWLRPKVIGLGTITAQAPVSAYFSGGTWLKRGDYPYSTWFTSPTGHVIPAGNIWDLMSSGTSIGNFGHWLAVHRYTYWVRFQQAGHLRLVRLEWSAILVLVAAALLAVTVWRVRSRMA